MWHREGVRYAVGVVGSGVFRFVDCLVVEIAKREKGVIWSPQSEAACILSAISSAAWEGCCVRL